MIAQALVDQPEHVSVSEIEGNTIALLTNEILSDYFRYSGGYRL